MRGVELIGLGMHTGEGCAVEEKSSRDRSHGSTTPGGQGTHGGRLQVVEGL